MLVIFHLGIEQFPDVIHGHIISTPKDGNEVSFFMIIRLAIE